MEQITVEVVEDASLVNCNVNKLLIKCQLDKFYSEKFKENCIDDEILKVLDDASLKELIPVVGHRIKFKETLKSWKLENESLLENVSLSALDVYVQEEFKSIETNKIITFELSNTHAEDEITSIQAKDILTEELLDGNQSKNKNSVLSTSVLRFKSSESNSLVSDDETCQEKLKWLQNSVEPWRMVVDYWNDTSKFRLEPIRLGLKEFTIADYFKTYPALRQPQGFTLLLEDFEKLYETKDGLYSNIILFREKIINLAREKQKKTRDKDLTRTITNYISLADDDTNQESLTNVALILLAYIINATQSKRRGKEYWKPSRSEIRDGFITQVASEAEVTSTIITRREKLQRLGRTLQPFIIFVGESVTQVKSSYVIVNNTCYQFGKLVNAVDAAFLFYATGALYPEECMEIWLVLQIGFYKIKTIYDRPNQSSTCLLNDLGLL